MGACQGLPHVGWIAAQPLPRPIAPIERSQIIVGFERRWPGAHARTLLGHLDPQRKSLQKKVRRRLLRRTLRSTRAGNKGHARKARLRSVLHDHIDKISWQPVCGRQRNCDSSITCAPERNIGGRNMGWAVTVPTPARGNILRAQWRAGALLRIKSRRSPAAWPSARVFREKCGVPQVSWGGRMMQMGSALTSAGSLLGLCRRPQKCARPSLAWAAIT
jgi:hypothetical protein